MDLFFKIVKSFTDNSGEKQVDWFSSGTQQWKPTKEKWDSFSSHVIDKLAILKKNFKLYGAKGVGR